MYPAFLWKERLEKVLKTLTAFLYFPVKLFNIWSLGTCLQEILIQCSNTHALSIGLPTQPSNCQRLGTWWRPQHDEGSNRLVPRLLIPCARCLHWSLEQMPGPQNYWSFTLLNICFGLVRRHPIAQLTLFKAGLLFSFLSPFIFLFIFFFLFSARRLKQQLHITIVMAVSGDRQNSPPTAVPRCVVSAYTHVSRWDKIRWSCISNPRPLFPNLSHPQAREKSSRNEVVYDFLIKLAFHFNLWISFFFSFPNRAKAFDITATISVSQSIAQGTYRDDI